MSNALAKRGVTPKQRLFALEWSKDCNATQAAIRAGYSARGADVQGHKLLSNAKVLELAQGHLATRLNRAELTADRILNEMLAVATVDIGRYLDIDERGIPPWTSSGCERPSTSAPSPSGTRTRCARVQATAGYGRPA